MFRKAHVTDLNKIYHIGTLARITKFVSLSREDTRMIISGIRRIKIAKKALSDYNVEFHRKTPEFDKYPNYIHDNSTNFDYKNPSVSEILKRANLKDNIKNEKIVDLPVISHIGILDYQTFMHSFEENRATV